MKKVIIRNRQSQVTHSTTMQDPSKWIEDQVSKNSWGKPERWVKEKVAVNISPLLKEYKYPQEVYFETDVIARKIENEISYVKLCSSYTIEIIDLLEDKEYLTQLCYKYRASEYPLLSDFADAYFHKENGNSEPMQLWLEKQAATKAKYPKP